MTGATTTKRETPEALLTVRNLSVHFRTGDTTVRAVDDVSLSIGRGEIVGLVGESGCGKSTLGMSLLRLIEAPGEIVGGEVIFDGRDLVPLPEKELRRIRGRDISLVVQNALAVMNPVTRVGEQLTEVLRDHGQAGRADRLVRARDVLASVGFPRPAHSLHSYPHQLSGGMQQRVSIAQSLLLGPRLIIADEPTTALDVTVQAQVLQLLTSACRTQGTSVLLITHDLGVVAETCDRVMVMYAGRVVESGPVRQIFTSPRHPYTVALLAALLPLRGAPPPVLQALPGQTPQPNEWPSGCRFNPRCPRRAALGDPAICEAEEPALRDVGAHAIACHFPGEDAVGTGRGSVRVDD
ncbi:ABC transporter ATP-binding protein [Sphaerisporangium perillae]|uniref:ABC transporter ATP-binding protein n=1 Tax=Sphaerisporangium perillae TaxID=2935860 RepID=UPI00200E7D1F|nr:ABC transporter ATP-binding protein [Sphaerisporangium perillae]